MTEQRALYYTECEFTQDQIEAFAERHNFKDVTFEKVEFIPDGIPNFQILVEGEDGIPTVASET